ncbi:hypothetical protein [Flaviaesturariibacter terrae]
MQPEVEQLQAENRRLSSLVAALAEKNLRLEEQLARQGGTPAPDRLPQRPVDVPQTQLAVPQSEVHGLQTSLSVPQNQLTGLRNELPAPADRLTGIQNGLPVLQSPLTGIQGNLPVPQRPLTGSAGELPAPIIPLPALTSLPPDLRTAWERTWKEAQHRARLQRLFDAGLPEATVAAALRKGPMGACRDTHIADAARLLLWLCGQAPERVSYAKLHGVTGLTDSGNNKLLASMRAKGLIRWKSFQVYEVTETGAALLEGLLPAL